MDDRATTEEKKVGLNKQANGQLPIDVCYCMPACATHICLLRATLVRKIFLSFEFVATFFPNMVGRFLRSDFPCRSYAALNSTQV